MLREDGAKGFNEVTPTPSFPMETKEESYKQILKSMTEQQMEVYKCFMLHPASADHEIADYLDLPLATINARRKELQDTGWIKLTGQQYFHETHRKRNVYNASFFPEIVKKKKVLSPDQLTKIRTLINSANEHQRKTIKAWLD